MGGSISQESIQRVVNKISNEIVTSIDKSFFFQTVSDCNTVQSLGVIFGEGSKTSGCSFEVRNLNQTVCNLEASSKVDSQDQIATNIQNKLDNLIKGSQESVQGFLATAKANQKSTQDLENAVTNIVKSFMNTNVSTTCKNILSVNQNGQFVVGKGAILECAPPPYNKIILTNDSITSASMKCVSDALSSAIMSNDLVNEITTKMVNEQRAKQEGFSLSFLIAILLLFLAPAVVVLFSSARLLAPVRNPKTGMVDLLPWAVNLTVLILMWMILIALILKIWQSIKNYFKKIFDKLNPVNWF